MSPRDRRRRAPWAGLLLFALSLFTLSCKGDDEAQIRALVRRAMEAANEKRVSGVVEDAAPEFRGPRGADLSESRRILLGFFMGRGWVRVFERRIEVTLLDGAAAKAEVEVVLAQGRPVEKLEDLLPTDATVLVFSLELVKRGGDWALTRAEYRQATR